METHKADSADAAVTGKCCVTLASSSAPALTAIPTDATCTPSIADVLLILLLFAGRPLLLWPGLKNERAWGKVKARKKEVKEGVKEVDQEAKPAVRIPCKSCPGCRVDRCTRCVPCQALPRRYVLYLCLYLVPCTWPGDVCSGSAAS